MKITDVLDQIGKDVLSEESKKMLIEAFEEAVTLTVTEKVKLEVEGAVKQLDESHASQLEGLLQKIDEEHTQKLMLVLKKVDEDHTSMLQQVIDRNKRVISEDAKLFKEELVAKISKYLDVAVQEKFPVEEIKEAVKNTTARKILEQVKQVVSIDEGFINETIREAVQDGKNTIDRLSEELNDAVKTNIEISQKLKATATDLVLEQKTAGFSKDKKSYVVRILKEKDPEFVTENFDHVVKMFGKEEDTKTQILAEDAKKKSTIVTGNVDNPRSKVKDESLLKESTEQEPVNEYLNVLKSQDSK